MVPNRPADNYMRIGVDDGNAIHPPISCPMLSNVTKPHPVGRMGAELAFHKVIMRGRQGFPAATFPLVTHTTSTSVPHESCNTFPPAGHSPFHGEVGVNPGSTIGSQGAFMRPLH